MLTVRTGQIFAEPGPDRTLWQVVQVIARPDVLPHARLRELATVPRRRILSCRTLATHYDLRGLVADDAPVVAGRMAEPDPAMDALPLGVIDFRRARMGS